MRIMLATDFSSYADTAGSLVSSMKLPAGSWIRVVHAVEPITIVGVFAPSAMLEISDVADREARALVADCEKLLAAEGREVDGVVGHGRAAEAILDACASFRPDLLVVGSRGRGGVATAVLGSVSAELVDRAPCPVLVARMPKLTSIVLAEDGSTNAAAGAHMIAELPIFASCAVRVVSVVDASFPIVFADPAIPATAVQAYRAYEDALPILRASHAAFARERAQALGRLGLQASGEQREGDAAAEIIAAAAERHADLIVIGSRGQTGLRRLLVGSVARSVLFHAPCSVLIAHARRSIDARPLNDGEPVEVGSGSPSTKIRRDKPAS
ncbi:MAG: universal stress protein [Candidatus Limnocylindria bacterium]|nr:universal stress protein [Candidatus Limnocylindria bacterium]